MMALAVLFFIHKILTFHRELSMLHKAEQYLQKYFGYDSFREGQARIVESILQGHDTVGILPTGGGKSICYQIPALLLEGVTIVISPLISLMKDQVDQLQRLGIRSAFINSTLSGEEVHDILLRAKYGVYKLLYIAPERLELESFRSFLRSLSPALIAIDEAHCVSHWGHDFRPSYLSVVRFIQELPARPVVAAFTATATEMVRDDIIHSLTLNEPQVFVTGFDRSNLSFSIVRGESKYQQLLSLLEERAGRAGIIYAATRKSVDDIHTFLAENGYHAVRYHAGMSDNERQDNQECFLSGDAPVMVATNAFGMGINKSNVRFVIHFNMPKNVESYYQEAGRAGRDGAASECILLFNSQDIALQKYLINQSVNDEQRRVAEYKKLQSMISYCHVTRCLRNYILDYFGEKRDQPCKNCSTCQENIVNVDVSVQAQMIFSCIRRMNERFGIKTVAQVLKGVKSKKLSEYNFHKLSTYGLLSHLEVNQLVEFMNILVAESYLTFSYGELSAVRLTEEAAKVLKGQAPLSLQIPKDSNLQAFLPVEM